MKKHLIKKVLFSLCILIMQNSFCQVNFKSGYIIDHKGDTIRGLIDYRNWSVNPKIITFKKSAEDQKTTYSPLDIRKFGVEDEVYEGAIVNIDKSSILPESLSKKAEIEYQPDTVFLQTLIGGEKNLFFYRDVNKKTYFFTKQGETFDYLVYKLYEKIVNGVPSIAYNKRYIGQLTVYFQDCPKIKNEIAKTSYTQKGLISLFNEYNKCTKGENLSNESREKLKFELGPIAGLSLTKFDLTGESSYSSSIIKFSTSKDITIGLFLNIVLPRNQGKFSINNELMYTHYSVEGNGSHYNSWGPIGDYYESIEFSYIKMNNMLRYKFPLKKIHLFLNAGSSIGFAIKYSTYKEGYFWVNTGIINYYEGPLLDEVRKIEYGINGGLGVAYKKISFEFREEVTNGFSSQSSLITKVNRMFFIVGYKF